MLDPVYSKTVATKLVVTELVLIDPADAIRVAETLTFALLSTNRNIPIA
jgi:hypothetical protein